MASRPFSLSIPNPGSHLLPAPQHTRLWSVTIPKQSLRGTAGTAAWGPVYHKRISQPAKLWGFICSGSAFTCFSLQMWVVAAFHVC